MCLRPEGGVRMSGDGGKGGMIRILKETHLGTVRVDYFDGLTCF
jgi:hypothetical protein